VAAKHRRFILHFIPTISSWLNRVERWFAELTNKAGRRGSCSRVPDLITAIEHLTTHHNRNTTPFVWTAKAEAIFAKLARCRERLEQLRPGCTARKSEKKKPPKSVWLFAPGCTGEDGRPVAPRDKRRNT
jgi:hypothetical protein